MIRPASQLGCSRIDVFLLLLGLACAGWVGARSEAEMETSLGLRSTQWLRDLSDTTRRMRALPGAHTKPLRERYAEAYPWSPIAWVNRFEASRAVWQRFAQVHERALAPLTVAGVAIGLVALRRPRAAAQRQRFGPGRVAAAVSVLFSATGLVAQYVLRRFDLMKHGIYHDTPSEFFEYNAQNMALATLAAWALLIPLWRWAALRGWREWLGVGLGMIWLVNLLWTAVLKPLAQR